MTPKNVLEIEIDQRMRFFLHLCVCVAQDLTLTKIIEVKNNPTVGLEACSDGSCGERTILDDYKDLFSVVYY